MIGDACFLHFHAHMETSLLRRQGMRFWPAGNYEIKLSGAGVQKLMAHHCRGAYRTVTNPADLLEKDRTFVTPQILLACTLDKLERSYQAPPSGLIVLTTNFTVIRQHRPFVYSPRVYSN